MSGLIVAFLLALISLVLSSVVWFVFNKLAFRKAVPVNFNPEFVSNLNDQSNFKQVQYAFEERNSIVRSATSSVMIRGVVVWLMSMPLTFLLGDPLIILIGMIPILMFFSPGTSSDKAAFFIVIIAAVPDYFEALMPFPGLQQLTNLVYWKIAAITVLVPIFLSTDSDSSNAENKFELPDLLIILFAILTSVLTYRTESITNVLRLLVDQFLLYFVIYFGISRAIKSDDGFNKCVLAFVFVSVILSCIGIVSQLMRWDFYQFPNIWSLLFTEPFRWGFLRLGLTVNPVSLGIILISGAMSLYYLKQRVHITFWMFGFASFVFLFVMLFTGTRAIFLGLLIAVSVQFLLNMQSLKLILLSIVSGVAAFSIKSSIDFSSLDEHGTFDYRAQLLKVSIDYMAKNPWWGDPYFMSSNEFQELIQGQGIIDIVNIYLQIGLEFGLVAMSLFALFIFILCFRLFIAHYRLWRVESARATAYKQKYSLMLSLIVSFATIIATTSNISIVMILGIIILAMGRATLGLQRNASI